MNIITVLASALIFPAALVGQTIGIRTDGNIQIEVDTVPTQQFWVSESADLTNWTRHTFVDRTTTIDVGLPIANSQFFKLESLYGQLTWSKTADMPVARASFTGGVIEGKLYIFGGNGADGSNLSRLDIYDLQTGEWARGADYEIGLEELSSAVVGGKLYVFGGHADTLVRVNLRYDPVSNAWSETATKPTQVSLVPAVVWGDEILIVGGDQGDEIPHATEIEAYDTQLNSWRHVTDLPERVLRPGAAIHEDVLYIIGGIDLETLTAYNRVRRFDLVNETWLPEIEGILPYPLIPVYTSACPVVNGKIIIGGGITTASGSFSISNIETDPVVSGALTVFDTETGGFIQNAPLPELFDGHIFLLVKNEIFALGGNPSLSPDSDGISSRMFIGGFDE